MEQTYVMLKPDALTRGLTGEIIARIERKGYKILAAKTMLLSEEILREHYAHLVNFGFFPSLLSFMMSGNVLGMVVEGPSAVLGMRMLMGATKVEEALPGTIRGDYAFSTTENLIHGSDSVENAQIEIARFFGK
ncbi:MAG: nucleoside-diphosphate kinase [Clostridia bacterium]